MPDFTQPSRVTPIKRRAGLDPASAAGYVVLAWVPGQAREDGGDGGEYVLVLSLNITQALAPVYHADLNLQSSCVTSQNVVPDLIRHLLQASDDFAIITDP